MAEKDTVHILCENGAVMVHDLPLPWGIEDRLGKGQIKLVEPASLAAAVAEAPAAETPAGEPEQAAEEPAEAPAPKKTTRAKAE